MTPVGPCPPASFAISVQTMNARLVCVLAASLFFVPLSFGIAGAQQAAPASPQDPGTSAAPEAAPPAGAEDESDGEREPRRIRINLNLILAQARLAMREGRFEEAVRLYQLVLRFAPGSRVARLELSFALAALGQRERASRLLRDIDREGLAPDVIEAIDRIVGPRRLIFFVVPEVIIDTNINGQTKKDVILINGVPFVLSEDAQGREAYGFGMTVGAAYRVLDEAPRTTLTAGLRVRDLNAREDDETHFFSSLSFVFAAGDRTTVTPSISGVYRKRAGDPYEVEQAGGLSTGFDLGSVRTRLSGQYRMIEGAGDFKDVRDRRRSEINSSFGYGFPGLGIRLDVRGFREDWQQIETQDNEGYNAALDFIFVKVPVVMPTIGAGYTYTHFENEAAFFNVRRLDREYEGHVELLFRDVNLFGTGAPSLRYRYRRVTSNIPLFDYDKHEVSIGIRAITF